MKSSLILLSFIKIQVGGLNCLDQLRWNDPSLPGAWWAEVL